MVWVNACSGDIWEINTVYGVEFTGKEEATIYRISRPANTPPLARLSGARSGLQAAASFLTFLGLSFVITIHNHFSGQH